MAKVIGLTTSCKGKHVLTPANQLAVGSTQDKYPFIAFKCTECGRYHAVIKMHGPSIHDAYTVSSDALLAFWGVVAGRAQDGDEV